MASSTKAPAANGTSLPHVPGTEPHLCAFDAFRIAIATKIATPLGIPLEKAYEGVDLGKRGADFTVALPRFRLGGKPEELSKKVLAAFEPDEYVESAEADKGLVSFMVRTKTLVRKVLTQIHDLTYNSPNGQPSYGTNSQGAGKKIVIEYSSPNIAKEFHAGHLRSTIIGAFLDNLHRASGWDVTAINYLGDWGKQFGMVAVGFARYGSEEALQKDAVNHLYEVYVKINADARADEKEKEIIDEEARAFFKRMEDGEPEAIKQWQRFRDFSLERYIKSYERLNIRFDVYGGESQVGQESQREAMKVIEEKGIIEDKEGAKLINLEKWKLGMTIIQKKDGTSVYITRDIGGAIERYEKYKFDKMIYVIASQQDLHVQQFFKVIELMGYPWASKLEHVNFGLVAGMSSRKGNAVSLDHILNEAKEVMHEQMRKNESKYANVEDPERTADEIGMSAVKVQDMAAKRINNYTFNWSRMLSFEGDTGPYLQYAHARLCSVQRKTADTIHLPTDTSLINTDLLIEPGARTIIYLLASYPDVVRTALKTYEPSGVVTFCFRLSHAISQAWESMVVMGQEEELAKARLWLFVCARDVLGAAMRLLSIRPLERM